jgi:hypothetical protein
MTAPTVTPTEAAIGDADDAHYDLERAATLIDVARQLVSTAEWNPNTKTEAPYVEAISAALDTADKLIQTRLTDLHQILDAAETAEEALPPITAPRPALVH